MGCGQPVAVKTFFPYEDFKSVLYKFYEHTAHVILILNLLSDIIKCAARDSVRYYVSVIHAERMIAYY